MIRIAESKKRFVDLYWVMRGHMVTECGYYSEEFVRVMETYRM